MQVHGKGAARLGRRFRPMLFGGAITLLAAAGAEGDGAPDVVVTDLDGLWVFRGDGQGGFREPEPYFIEGGVEPWSVAVGDLTGDGLPELVSANRLAAHAAVFDSDGKGGYSPAPRILATAERPYDVDLGDLDRDGDLDVAITCNFNPGEVLLLFNGGRGEFGDRERLLPGGETFNSVLADLDGKNGLDLVVTRNTARDLAIHLNLGDGTFQLAGNAPAGNDPKALRAGDFDGDGSADVAVANDTAGRITVFLGNGAGGLTQRGSYAAGVQPRELTVVDLNGDSFQDLVVAGGRGANFVARFLGNGDGTFRGPADFATGPRPNSVGAGDFDGDGKPDVAAANWSLDDPPLASLSILYGDGAGEFPRKVDLTPPGGFRKITALAVGELDPPAARFKRGDVSADGRFTITDPILLLRYLFGAGSALPCLDAADVNDSGTLTVTDAVLLLGWLFQRGSPPAAPFPDPGVDLTADRLGCGGS